MVRNSQFRKFESIHLGPHEWNAHPQAETLIRELEHVFCAGAWVATIVIAQAVVEVSIAAFDKKGLRTPDFLDKYELKSSAEWLRDQRNPVVHRHSAQGAAITLERQLFFRESLRLDAKKAVAYALGISFLPSRHPEVQISDSTN
ncbi:hypothetical protein K3169_01155 [Pseudomonas phytophila]|uniref:Uncharacterized protein n=1 Tax=Pseudomonas phytophila TaxID=2867264 RepID=A0ABY6FF96_9PSED|nr:hypothetical protein [Pseudomonas phytophila]UXZ96557.1 hypothetical protein K3169_01155 [Pseudomonas phytophila]